MRRDDSLPTCLTTNRQFVGAGEGAAAPQRRDPPAGVRCGAVGLLLPSEQREGVRGSSLLQQQAAAAAGRALQKHRRRPRDRAPRQEPAGGQSLTEAIATGKVVAVRAKPEACYR